MVSSEDNLLSSSKEDEADALRYFSLAREFMFAAKELLNSMPSVTTFDVVTKFILGHSAELFLKAYLRKVGLSAKDLAKRPYRHDISSLLSAAESKGLHGKYPYLQDLSETYCGKLLEYRDGSSFSVPSNHDLITDVVSLSRVVGDAL